MAIFHNKVTIAICLSVLSFHLKEAVDEIRETGRYVFRQDKKRLTAYASEYRRQIKSKQKQKPKKKATRQ
jgi:hypothetical protein